MRQVLPTSRFSDSAVQQTHSHPKQTGVGEGGTGLEPHRCWHRTRMHSGARGPPGPGENRGLKGCPMRPGHQEVGGVEGGVPAPPGLLG